MIIDYQKGAFSQQKGYFIGNVPIYNFSVAGVSFDIMKVGFEQAEAGVGFTQGSSNVTFTKIDP